MRALLIGLALAVVGAPAAALAASWQAAAAEAACTLARGLPPSAAAPVAPTDGAPGTRDGTGAGAREEVAAGVPAPEDGDPPWAIAVAALSGDGPVAHGLAIRLALALREELHALLGERAEICDDGRCSGAERGTLVTVAGAVSCAAGTCHLALQAERPAPAPALRVTVAFDPPAVDVTARDVDARLGALAGELGARLRALTGPAGHGRFGAFTFATFGRGASDLALGQFLADELTVRLTDGEDLTLVPPSALREALADAQRSPRDLDFALATDLVTALGLDAAILGAVIPGSGGTLTVRAQVAPAEGQGSALDDVIFPAAALAAAAGTHVAPPWRHYALAVLPGVSQLADGAPVRGVAILAAEAILFGASTLFHLDGVAAERRYHGLRDPTRPRDFTAAYERANTMYTFRDVGFALAAAGYALHWLDALNLWRDLS